MNANVACVMAWALGAVLVAFGVHECGDANSYGGWAVFVGILALGTGTTKTSVKS